MTSRSRLTLSSSVLLDSCAGSSCDCDVSSFAGSGVDCCGSGSGVDCCGSGSGVDCCGSGSGVDCCGSGHQQEFTA